MILFSFLLGISIGSFLLCLCHRLCHKVNLSQRSYCPKCKKKLLFWMLIPLLSYLVLKAKCHFCKTKIPISYFIVEILTGILFVFTLLKIFIWWELVFFWVSWSIFLLIALFDWKKRWFYSHLLVILFILRCLSFFLKPFTVLEYLLGMFIGAGFFYFVAFFYQFFTNKDGLGEGDIALLGILGFYFGWESLLPIVLYGSFLGLLLGIFLLIKKKKNSPFAFTPSLICGAFLHWIQPSFYDFLQNTLFSFHLVFS